MALDVADRADSASRHSAAEDGPGSFDDTVAPNDQSLSIEKPAAGPSDSHRSSALVGAVASDSEHGSRAPERLEPGSDASNAAVRSSERRRRSGRSSRRRRLRQAFRGKHLFKAAAIVLPIIGFIHVSISNGVLTPTGERSSTKPSKNSSSLLNATPSQAASLGGIGTVVVGGLPDPSGHSIDTSPEQPDQAHDSSLVQSGKPGETSSGQLSRSGDISPVTTYRVDEGSSLWRVGQRFIDDEVVLDRLIDNLEQSGMDVTRVFPGAEFIVERIDDRHQSVRMALSGVDYVSRIIDGQVITMVTRRVAIPVVTRFADDAVLVGLDSSLVKVILDKDEELALGIADTVPGERIVVERRDTRQFGSQTTRTDIVSIEKNGETLWQEPADADRLTVSLND